VARHIVSAGSLEIGEASFVALAAVAETNISLEAGVRIGQPSWESAGVVSAGNEIHVQRNVGVWGKIAAGRAVVTVGE
jgi:hypothetical protein